MSSGESLQGFIAVGRAHENSARAKLSQLVDALRSNCSFIKYTNTQNVNFSEIPYPIQKSSSRRYASHCVNLGFLYVATKSPPHSRIHGVYMYILYTVERTWRVCYSFPLCIFDTNINSGVDVVSLRQ